MNAQIRRRLALQIATSKSGIRTRRAGSVSDVESVATASKDAVREQVRRARKQQNRAA